MKKVKKATPFIVLFIFLFSFVTGCMYAGAILGGAIDDELKYQGEKSKKERYEREKAEKEKATQPDVDIFLDYDAFVIAKKAKKVFLQLKIKIVEEKKYHDGVVFNMMGYGQKIVVGTCCNSTGELIIYAKGNKPLANYIAEEIVKELKK